MEGWRDGWGVTVQMGELVVKKGEREAGATLAPMPGSERVLNKCLSSRC